MSVDLGGFGNQGKGPIRDVTPREPSESPESRKSIR